MKRNILIIPTNTEAEPFLKVLSPCLQLNKFPFQLHLTETGKDKTGWALLVCGIGQTRAACATTFALNNFAVSRIIMCGIAGAVHRTDPRLKPGNIIVAESEKYLRFGRFNETKNYWPDTNETKIPLSFKMYRPDFINDTNIPVLPFGCSDQLTESPEEQQFLLKYHPEIMVENMEGAAFAHCCHIFNQNATEIRVISNYTGQKVAEWKRADALKGLKIIAESFHDIKGSE